MFFTQDDYKKIQQWLIKNSVKDTEFSEANIPFNGNEIVSIVQGNQNKKVLLKDLVAQVFNLGISDFVNITDKYDAPNISLEEAIRLIPSRARKEGQVITFLDMEDHWHIYQFKGVLNQWNVLDTWEDLFDWEKLIIDSILPDEEDLTKTLPDKNGNSYLSFKNKRYNKLDFSGLGKVYLRKNIINEVNILLQKDINKDNTIYIIQYDYDLGGATIEVPEGCILDFQGGSLSNGVVIGTNTIVKASKKAFELDIKLSGSWEADVINSSCFGLVSDLMMSDDYKYVSGTNNCQGFKNMMFFKNVVFTKGDYYVEGLVYINNTNINGNGSVIKAKSTGKDYLYIPLFWVGSLTNKAVNITIENLTVVGSKPDVSEKTETIHGFQIVNADNVTFKNVTAKYCRGDGFYLGYDYATVETEYKLNYIPTNIRVVNCVADNNHRQGLSITGGENILLEGCTFSNTSGTAPQCGVDIEPFPYKYADGTYANLEVKNVDIRNCIFEGNNYSGLYLYSLAIPHIPVYNIRVSHCYFKTNKANGISVFRCKDVSITDCYFVHNKADGIYFEGEEANGIVIDKCYFEGECLSGQNAIAFTKTVASTKEIKNVIITNSVVKGFGYPFLSDGTGTNIHHITYRNISIVNCNGGFYGQTKGEYYTYQNIHFDGRGIKPDGTPFGTYAAEYSVADNPLTRLMDYYNVNNTHSSVVNTPYANKVFYDNDLHNVVAINSKGNVVGYYGNNINDRINRFLEIDNDNTHFKVKVPYRRGELKVTIYGDFTHGVVKNEYHYIIRELKGVQSYKNYCLVDEVYNYPGTVDIDDYASKCFMGSQVYYETDEDGIEYAVVYFGNPSKVVGYANIEVEFKGTTLDSTKYYGKYYAEKVINDDLPSDIDYKQSFIQAVHGTTEALNNYVYPALGKVAYDKTLKKYVYGFTTKWSENPFVEQTETSE